MAAQLMVTRGLWPSAAVVDGLGHDFLAGAGFAGDEHVGAARRDF